MDFLGIDVSIENKPILEPGFLPGYKFLQGYLKGASQPYAIAWERANGNIAKFATKIYGTKDKEELDLYFIKYLSHLTNSFYGGWKLYLCGDTALSQKIKDSYSTDPSVAQVLRFTKMIFHREVEIEVLAYEDCPENEEVEALGNHWDGCRIGFDAGASDRKVSAVIDGEVVYSEEVIWYAKFRSDISYHHNEILTAFKTAASKMPRVDAIGVSTAGGCVNNLMTNASFYRMVPPEDVAKYGLDIYQRVTAEIGDNIPLVVINDGNVAALAGAINLKKNSVLGVAIGTSIGMGYVDAKGNLNDMTTEISMPKLALNQDAAPNESGLLIGCGESYFSQQAVIRNAEAMGVEMDEKLYPAEKLLVIQKLMEEDDPNIQKIYRNIGVCFAHVVPLISMFFDIENIYLLGRVVSAKGGEMIFEECKRVLAEEYPEINEKITVWLPSENDRRVSQSVAAASLPIINK